MKSLRTFLVFCLALAAGTFALAAADSSGLPQLPSLALSTTTSLDYVSAYTFRGAKLAGDSLQPGVNLQFGSLYANVWGTRALRGSTNSEVDVTLGMGGFVGLDVGLTTYTYPGSSRTTWEPFISAGRDLTSWAKVSLAGYRDVTLCTNTAEAKAAVTLLTLGAVELTVEGAAGLTGGGGLVRYGYWSAGPVVRCRLTEAFSVSTAGQYVSSTRGAELGRDRVTGRAGVTWSF